MSEFLKAQVTGISSVDDAAIVGSLRGDSLEPPLAIRDLSSLVASTTAALSVCVDEDGTLWDPASSTPTPRAHYASTFAALALAAARPDDPKWQGLIDRWSAIPTSARGHAQFNRLALLLLAELLASAAPELADARESLEPHMNDLVGRERRRFSNNCVLLALACDVLEETRRVESRSLEGRRADALRHFDDACASWLTARSGFFDFPNESSHGIVSAPICYHAKCSLLLALVTRVASTGRRRRTLRAATEWLEAFTDEETGNLGGFGRSSHALYGAACALFAYADAHERATREDERARYAERVSAICGMLERSRRPDGLLSLTPNRAIGAAGGWDRYMHLSVYNGFAAGLLSYLLAIHLPLIRAETGFEVARPERGEGKSRGEPERGGLPDVFVDREAGLLACRGSRATAFLSLRGSPVQEYDADSVDLRYAGMQPFFVRCDGDVVVGPSLRVPRRTLISSPHLAGFTPIFSIGSDLYGLSRFEFVDLDERRGRVLVVAGGQPRRLHDVARRRNSPLGWMKRADSRLLDGRYRRIRSLRPPPLTGHRAVVAIAFDGEAGWWGVLTVLLGADSEATFLNPLGHRWLGTTPNVSTASSRGRGTGIGHSGPLPSPLPAAMGACGPATPWPEEDTCWTVLAGPACEGRAPVDVEELLRVDLAECRISTPWAERVVRRDWS